jgi:putative flippase GtrA
MSYKEVFEHQSVYWIGVGIFTKASDYFVFILTLNFTNNIPLSNLVAAIFSISLNFNLHARMTFRKRKKKNAFWKYFLSTSIFLVLETTFLIFSKSFGLDVRVIKALTLLLFTILGALTLDRWVFKDHKPSY